MPRLRPALAAALLAATPLATPLARPLVAPLAAQTPEDGRACARAVDDAARNPDARARLQTLAAAAGPVATFAQGCLALVDGQYARAGDLFDRAATANPASAVAQFWLGRAYGEQAQRANVFKQAALARRTKAAFERAVQLDASYVDPREGLLQYYLLAPSLLGGSEEKARQQAAEIRARSAYRGAFASAQIAQKRKDWPAVAREMDALTRQYPDSMAPWIGLGNALGQQRKWDEAWAAADRMLAAMDGAPGAQYVIGRLAAESGTRLDRGEAALLKYLQHTPSRGEPSLAAAHWRLGAVREKQGRREQARAEYEAALKLDPKLDGAKEGLGRVR